MCVPACLYVHHTCAGNCRGQSADPLKLAFKAAVNHLMWVLGIELRSSERAANTLNC